MRISDLAVFVIYLAGIVIFGSTFYRKNRSAEAFTLGNRSFPVWVVAMSIFATFVSSISYLAVPGQAYLTNWNAFAFSLSLPVAAWVAVKFFVPHYRSVNSPSAYTYLEKRFGRWAKRYVATMYLLTQLMRSGTILLLLALPLNVLLGWDIGIIIMVTGVCVMVYALLGGIQAVMWTDAIQGIILIAGAVICGVILLFSMPEGPGQVFDIAAEYDKFSLGSFDSSLRDSTFWVVLVYGLFINLQNYGIDQNYIQRYMTARSEREAKKSALIGGLMYIPVSALFLFIGTALFSFYKASPGLLPDGMAADSVFPYFMVNQLPAGITGLLIASVFAAGMSTISTSVNSSATVILTDFFRIREPGGRDNDSSGRSPHPDRDESSSGKAHSISLKETGSMYPLEKQRMKILYLSSGTFMVASVGIAMAMVRVDSILDAWWKLASIFSGGMLGLFLLGFVTRRVKNSAAVAGVLSGLLVIAWMSLSGLLPEGTSLHRFANPFHSYLTVVLGTSAIFLTGFLVSIASRTFKRKNPA